MTTPIIPPLTETLFTPVDSPAVRVPLELIDDSPYQLRTSYDPEKLAELAEKMASHGQLTDAIARRKAEGRVELIAGHRRKRGAGINGWAVLNCKLVEIGDDEARELVMIEQLQHEDFKPSEEAVGYRDLLALRDEQGGPRFSLATLAARIGKKEGHIRELVSLLETPAAMRAAVDEGRVSKRAAAYVASIPDERDRAEASRMVLDPPDKSSPLTAEETIQLVQTRFVRSLQGAPFKLKDETLLPAAGSCERCELRTGNMKVYEGLLSGGGQGVGGMSGIAPNLCTKPSCYAQKCAAVAEKVKAEAQARGCELMPDDEAKRLFEKDGTLRWNIDYVERNGRPDPTLCHHFDEGKMPTWKQLLAQRGGKARASVKAWLARNPVTGDFVELIKWQDAVRAITAGDQENGVEPFFKVAQGPSARSAGDGDALKPGDNIMLSDAPQNPMWDEATARETKAEAREQARRDTAERLGLMRAIHRELVVKLGLVGGRPAVNRLFIEQMLQFVGCDEVIDEMCGYYGIQEQTEESLDDVLMQYETLPANEKAAFAVMIMVRRLALSFGVKSESVGEWMDLLGVEGPAAGATAEERDQEQAPAPAAAVPPEGNPHPCDECGRIIVVPVEEESRRLRCESGEFRCTHCMGDWSAVPDEQQPESVKAKLGIGAPAVDPAPAPVPAPASGKRKAAAGSASTRKGIGKAAKGRVAKRGGKSAAVKGRKGK